MTSNDLSKIVEISVVMPCLNEARTIEACVTQALDWIRSRGVAGEVIVADNGSSDGSPALAEKAGACVVPVAEKGYGAALMGGIRAAHGKYVVMGDADRSYDFSSLDPFLEKLRAGFDLVMGNRFAGGIKDGAMPFLHRYLGNPVLSGLGRLFFRCPCRDFHCGLRGFNRQSILDLNLRTGGMEFASEMVVKAMLANYQVCEVPTTLSPDGRDRAPHLRTWRDGWRHLRFLLIYCPRWLFVYPGYLFMLVGGLLMSWIAIQPQFLLGMRLEVHSQLAGAFMLLLGFQLCQFGLFVRVYAAQQGLLPSDFPYSTLAKKTTLEQGIVVGLFFIVIGLLLAGYVLGQWIKTNFGELPRTDTLRIFTPGLTLGILGVQTIFGSFFLSILGLGARGITNKND